MSTSLPKEKIHTKIFYYFILFHFQILFIAKEKNILMNRFFQNKTIMSFNFSMQVAPHLQYLRNNNTVAECGWRTPSGTHNVSNFGGNIPTHEALISHYKIIYKFHTTFVLLDIKKSP